jgi:hypothetical protein
MCYNHFVSSSRIPDAGLGAYMCTEILAGAYLGWYEGCVLMQEEAAVSMSLYLLHWCNIGLNWWEVIDASNLEQSN